MFAGYAGQPPFCFVLCGNFLEPKSTRSNYSYARLQEGFVQLAKVIQSSESIAKESNFVIVPGPGDLTRGPFHILPRYGVYYIYMYIYIYIYVYIYSKYFYVICLFVDEL